MVLISPERDRQSRDHAQESTFKAVKGCPNSYTFPRPSLHVNPAIHAEALAGIIIPIYDEVANDPSYLLRCTGSTERYSSQDRFPRLLWNRPVLSQSHLDKKQIPLEELTVSGVPLKELPLLRHAATR